MRLMKRLAGIYKNRRSPTPPMIPPRCGEVKVARFVVIAVLGVGTDPERIKDRWVAAEPG